MIAVKKPVKRETSTIYRGRPLIAEMHAGYVVLREKGRRAGVSVDWCAIYDLGWKLLARQKAEEKRKAKRIGK
jgi:hypothetical protein